MIHIHENFRCQIRTVRLDTFRFFLIIFFSMKSVQKYPRIGLENVKKLLSNVSHHLKINKNIDNIRRLTCRSVLTHVSGKHSSGSPRERKKSKGVRVSDLSYVRVFCGTDWSTTVQIYPGVVPFLSPYSPRLRWLRYRECDRLILLARCCPRFPGRRFVVTKTAENVRCPAKGPVDITRLANW